MSGEELRERLKDFWGEFRKVRFGMAGLVLLALFVLLVAFEPLLTPFKDTNRRWNDISYWDDYPVNAPPVWVNLLSSSKAATTRFIREYREEQRQSEGVRLVQYLFAYQFVFDKPPADLILHFAGEGNVPVIASIRRPDGVELELSRRQFSLEQAQDARITVDKDARAAVLEFLRAVEPEQALATLDPSSVQPTRALFAVAEAGMLQHPRPLQGEYQVVLTAVLLSEEATLRDPYLVVSGWVSGLLGTDNSKRDVASGVLAGVKWALLIGLLTASVAVVFGVMIGIISAYSGGAVDWTLQRLYELFQNIPLLPLLIVISAVFKPSIWFMIVVMMLFFWTGPVKTVYSITLQLKEETYVEAARALGASRTRIIFRHLVPLLLPYSFASMALYLPSVIVYEATVSLLGLGDATIVTWGRILHDALTGGAVINRIWWWVIPPGLLIALMGMTFAFIGFAMDKILHPKLRTR
jgi:peptide/nickel transport system permease protein